MFVFAARATCWNFSVTSVQTTAPLSRPHGQDQRGPGQGWNLNPVCLCGWVADGCWWWGCGGVSCWLGPMGFWTWTLQCHIPFPSTFCWRFTTPGRTMSRRASPCRWEPGVGWEMTRCLPWNRLTPCCTPPFPSYDTETTKTDQMNVYCWCYLWTLNGNKLRNCKKILKIVLSQQSVI